LNLSLKKIDNNEKVITIFLDMKKVFDTVDHNELLRTLPSFGIVKNKFAIVQKLSGISR